jgi:type II secretion system protein J
MGGGCLSIRRSKGFTLIEVLIALSILAMIFGLLYGTLSSTQRLASATEGDSEIYRQAQIALSRMSSELSMVYWTRSPITQGSFIGEDLSRFDERRESRPADSLSFLALSHPRLARNAPEGDLVRVSYLLDGDLLVRQAELPEGGQATRIVLAEGVAGLNFRYYDPRAKDWVDRWESGQDPAPPDGVEIGLTFRDPAGREKIFVSRTDLPMVHGKG